MSLKIWKASICPHAQCDMNGLEWLDHDASGVVVPMKVLWLDQTGNKRVKVANNLWRIVGLCPFVPFDEFLLYILVIFLKRIV